jgi:hypothetical protein
MRLELCEPLLRRNSWLGVQSIAGGHGVLAIITSIAGCSVVALAIVVAEAAAEAVRIRFDIARCRQPPSNSFRVQKTCNTGVMLGKVVL